VEPAWFGGVDVAGTLLAWARVAPTIALVPAFGLKALPSSARAMMGLALGAAIAPAVAPEAYDARAPWLVAALAQILRGMPIAIAAATPLWIATMAGGVADALRGAQEGSGLAVVEGRAASFGILFSLFASSVFLATGGPAHVATALASAPLEAHPLGSVAHALAAGIGIAVAIASPVLAASVVVEVVFAFAARAASPAQVHALFAPLRALGLLAVAALVLERLATLMAEAVRAS